MPQTQGRLWIRLMNHHKVIRDLTVPCAHGEVERVLMETLPKLDLSQPMWLDRHRLDWEQYGLCTFRPEHFLEPVPFERMTLTYIPDENEKGRPARRRNPLEDA